MVSGPVGFPITVVVVVKDVVVVVVVVVVVCVGLLTDCLEITVTFGKEGPQAQSNTVSKAETINNANKTRGFIKITSFIII